MKMLQELLPENTSIPSMSPFFCCLTAATGRPSDIGSDEPEQNEKQNDQQDQTQTSGGIVTPAGAVRPGWQRTYQQKN
jgi:hypothetical protein